MGILGHLIASEMESGHGGSNVGPILLIAAAVVVAVLIYRNQAHKARARVNVRRMPDAGRVQLDHLPDQHSLSVGVRVRPDHTGVQTLLEGAR